MGEVAHAKRRTTHPETSRWTVAVDDRSAVLIIRVWVEDGPDSFRGRLTTVDPVGADDPAENSTFAVSSSPSDILDAVREWLGLFEQRVTGRIDMN